MTLLMFADLLPPGNDDAASSTQEMEIEKIADGNEPPSTVDHEDVPISEVSEGTYRHCSVGSWVSLQLL